MVVLRWERALRGIICMERELRGYARKETHCFTLLEEHSSSEQQSVLSSPLVHMWILHPLPNPAPRNFVSPRKGTWARTTAHNSSPQTSVEDHAGWTRAFPWDFWPWDQIPVAKIWEVSHRHPQKPASCCVGNASLRESKADLQRKTKMKERESCQCVRKTGS